MGVAQSLILLTCLYHAELLVNGTSYQQEDELSMFMVFTGLVVASILVVLTIPLIVQIVNKRFSLHWDDFLMLPVSFGVSRDNELRASLRSVEEVVEFSKEVWDFCQDRNISMKRTHLLALAKDVSYTSVLNLNNVTIRV